MKLEELKARPILFSAPMVRAILSGAKTQTRRVVRPPGKFTNKPGDVMLPMTVKAKWINAYGHSRGWRMSAGSFNMWSDPFECPYGAPGDHLWVRESWAANATLNKRKPVDLRGEKIYYRATYSNDSHFAWRPSIHMPRWASRITLEVLSVRVERLQEITEADAKAEGIVASSVGGELNHRGRFHDLWDSINGKRHPWSSNPWVWVVSFHRIKP